MWKMWIQSKENNDIFSLDVPLCSELLSFQSLNFCLI